MGKQLRSGSCHHPTSDTKCNERPSQATANPVGGKACSSTKAGLLRYIPNTFSIHKVSSLKFAYLQGRLSRHTSLMTIYLRLECQTHKKKNCSCGEIETVEHYLINYEKYFNEREKMRTNLFYQTDISELTIEILLGINDSDLKKNHELTIISALGDFITQTARFRKPAFCICEIKDAKTNVLLVLIICAVTAQPISAFVFAPEIVQRLFFLNMKFQASVFFVSTVWFVSDLVRDPDCWFSHAKAQIYTLIAHLMYS